MALKLCLWFSKHGFLSQVGSLRVSWCLATWSTSLCHSCLWSTAMSSSVHGTPSQHEAWRRMKLRWMRWRRRCSMSPKRRDCSQPRDASPSPSGSTSFYLRRRETDRETWRTCEIAWPAHRRTESQRRRVLSALGALPRKIQDVSVQVPQRRPDSRTSVKGDSSSTHPEDMSSAGRSSCDVWSSQYQDGELDSGNGLVLFVMESYWNTFCLAIYVCSPKENLSFTVFTSLRHLLVFAWKT